MQIQLKRRSVGENIGLTFSLVMAHLPRLLILLVVLNLPLLLLQSLPWMLSGADAGSPSVLALLGVIGFVGLVLSMLTGCLGTGASLLLVSSSFLGTPISLRASVAGALRRFFGILGASITYSLIIFVGLLLLIVPGLIFLTMFYVTVCVLLLEKHGVFDSLGRSRELTRGQGWSVFFYIIVLALIGVAITIGGQALLAMFTEFGIDGSPASMGALFGTWCLSVITGLFWTIGPAVVYFDLRVKKEGFDVQTLAELVDDIGRRRVAASQDAR